jgi:prevent-host-death family protein
MVNTITLKELRPSLPTVMEKIDEKLDRYVVTKRGHPVAVLLHVDDYESLIETLDILTDPRALKAFRRGQEDIRKGRLRSWQEIKRDLAQL